MLYEARQTRVLKTGYQVKHVTLQQPGLAVRYVPVFRSPSGDEVFEDEATLEGIAIVGVPNAAPSRDQRERAIAELIPIVRADPPRNVDRSELKHALEVMAVEAELKLHVGQEASKTFPHENPWAASFAVRLLTESGLKGAIKPLTRLLVYETSQDHRSTEDSVHDMALAALRKYLADNDRFRKEAALEAMNACLRQSGEFYVDYLKTWAIEVLVGMIYPEGGHRNWALEQLKELAGFELAK